ncbi:MBL fold metallo-hydrolase [Mesorhizobium sp. WSM4310]|uniref:ComEC/Rec2 family competence protein n=1 Tax=Mesorhizobium sp. WSM4310 TaxID=2589883 RepID=UPI00163D9207|nr:MBL fold metallo-hydrolase [Mesorhizobium sp. WSM4310]
MLRLEVLPAGCGDCLWIEYGEPRDRHILVVDGGLKETAEVLTLRIARAAKERNVKRLFIDLLVVTHIDNDHIGGILELFQRSDVTVDFGDIWFNGSQQLRNLLGLAEGEAMSTLLEARGGPWNDAFGGKAVMVEDEGEFPFRMRQDKLRLTILGPFRSRLDALWGKWEDFLQKEAAREAEEPSDLLGEEWPPVWTERESRDNSIANASSIVLLLEYAGRRLLLAADAHANDIAAAVGRLPERYLTKCKLPLDGFKLSHHGSKANLSRALLEKLDCSRYIISTDSTAHEHPHGLALLRVLRYGTGRPSLMFNYETTATARWRDQKDEIVGFADFDTAYPDRPERGLIIEWNDRP